MNNKKNAISAIALQGVTIVQGIILPRLILEAFGSEINGLISSINQFLGFISLLEGGLGAVVLAELYIPIAERNIKKIRSILVECQGFFNKLAVCYLGYTTIMSIIYPLAIVKKYSFIFTSSMVIILSLTTLIQYLFSITYKLFLQANQKLYIVNNISAITVALNTLSAIIIIQCFPEIHIVKLASGFIYLLQPILLRRYIDRQFQIQNWGQKVVFWRKSNNEVLQSRWSGFAQNLAHFINMNTDVVLLTFFSSLESVSVYTIYLLAIAALKGIISSVGNSYQSALGQYIAEGNAEKLKTKFEKFENLFWMGGTVLFGSCLLLINPFVTIYTNGIKDANYYRPVFAGIIVIANMLYIIREPYRLLILAAGKFKETNFGAVVEAVLNLTISILLVKKYDLVGVAIGTFVAIIFRLLYFIWFLKRAVLYRGYSAYWINVFSLISVIAVDLFLYSFPLINITSFLVFGIYGIASVLMNTIIYCVINLVGRKIFIISQKKCNTEKSKT